MCRIFVYLALRSGVTWVMNFGTVNQPDLCALVKKLALLL